MRETLTLGDPQTANAMDVLAPVFEVGQELQITDSAGKVRRVRVVEYERFSGKVVVEGKDGR